MLHGNEPERSLPEKQAQADVLRLLRKNIQENPFASKYKGVKAYQDKHESWDMLTYIKQLNVWVDHLAGKVLLTGLEQHDFFSSSPHPNRLESSLEKEKADITTKENC